MSPMSQAAQNLNWLITNFVDNTPGVSHTVVVSADGLLLAMSEGFPRDRADQLAAVASGLTSLTAGASRIFEGGHVNQTVVEMERGFLFIMSVSDGSSLAVLAHPEADIGLVGYGWPCWWTVRATCSPRTSVRNCRAAFSTSKQTVRFWPPRLMVRWRGSTGTATGSRRRKRVNTTRRSPLLRRAAVSGRVRPEPFRFSLHARQTRSPLR